MIELHMFEEEIKKNKIHNCYVFCGEDEELIKSSISKIVNRLVDKNFSDLNYVKFDGSALESGEAIVNACETLPFMSDKKVVLVYRASFLSSSEEKNKHKLFDFISKYIGNMSPECVLILYYIFKDKREKPSKKIYALDKKACVVKAGKIKGRQIESKVKELLESRGKNIGKVELKLFCSALESNMGVIENEVEKLYCYTFDREITKKDIFDIFPKKSDEDIFDLVDLIGDKKAQKAIDNLNELMYKGEQASYILYMIERQFKLLYKIKDGISKGMDKNMLTSSLKLHPYVCEKLITQSKKFTLKQITRALDLCLNSEEKLKSSTVDEKIEMELLIISSITS